MTKKISVEEIRKLAQLANLSLTEDEVSGFSSQISQIVGYIALLNEVDTTNISPMHFTNEDIKSTSTSREDIPDLTRTFNPSQKKKLKISKEIDKKSYFKVDKVLDL